jgi:hypothetical protein
MLLRNECPLGESLRGMPMANVAPQRMPFGRISSRNASRMSSTDTAVPIFNSTPNALEYRVGGRSREGNRVRRML